ncbi:MAG: DUF6263 family protein [Flavobacteriales bacterium]
MNRVVQSILILAITVSSCAVAKINTEEVLLRYHPEAGSVYDMSSNVNIALNTAQPVNINMDLFVTVTFDKSPADTSFRVTSTIKRVKSIASSSIFHRSYDSENPLLQNEVEKQMHDQFSRILNVDFCTEQNDKGEKLKEYEYDSIFGAEEKMKAQFKEMEQSISNTSLIFPDGKVKVGTSWEVEINSQSSVYPVLQKITYTVSNITDNEVFLKLKGVIEFDTDEVAGGGKVEGTSVIDRKSGVVKSSKTNQVMTMIIGEYRATSANVIEVRNVRRM